jgi:hypothetical protein
MLNNIKNKKGSINDNNILNCYTKIIFKDNYAHNYTMMNG